VPSAANGVALIQDRQTAARKVTLQRDGGTDAGEACADDHYIEVLHWSSVARPRS